MPTSSTESTVLPRRFRLGAWVVDSDAGELSGSGGRVALNGLSMALLLALVRRAGDVCDTDSLIAEVWERGEVSDATLQQRVKLLRKALNDDSDTPVYIATVRGRGYRLLLQPEVLEAEPGPDPDPVLPVVAPVRRRLHFVLAGVLVLVLALVAAGWWYASRATPGAAVLASNHLVVLPLKLAPGTGDDAQQADSLTEQLIWSLSRVPGLVVIGRSSSMSYKDDRRTLDRLAPDLARDLGVNAVLEGVIQPAGARLHISLTLTDVASMRVLWTRGFDTAEDGLTNLHAQIAEQVAQALGVMPDKAVQGITDGDAYTLYLRGRQRYLRYTAKDNAAAMELFRASLVRSPAYAPALAGLSDSYAQAVYQFGSPEIQLKDALRYADAAVALAPRLAEAHKARGLALDLLGRRQEAAASYHSASALNPNYSDALINEAILQWEGGRLADAWRLAQRAIALDPLDPYSHLITAQVLTSAGFAPAAREILARVQQHAPDDTMAQTIGCAHWFETGEGERAERECQALLKQHPDYEAGWSLSGDVALANGQPALALQRFTRAASLGGAGSDSFYARLRLAIIEKKDHGAALAPLVRQLRSKIAQHDEDPELYLHLAMLLAAAGQVDDGVAALDAAVTKGFSDSHWLQTDPVLAPLRQHVKYARLLSRLDERLRTEHNKLDALLKARGPLAR
jgi:DNA-binding winged helix-turn-helix (wHTH) protein/TolB-like protein/Tfp pilus assembly protein PilF